MTSPLQLSSLGERINLQLQQGATFGPITATMTNPDTTPVNLTGCTIFGSVRKTALAADPAAAVITVAITNAAGGIYTFTIPAATTDGLTAGEQRTAPESQYVWDLFLKDAAGRVLPLYYGDVMVLRRVTRPTP